MKLVSVIIPTRNRYNYLKLAIESVLLQTWKNIEIIIVDEASSDKSVDYLNNLASNRTIILIRNDKPTGGGNARNLGIAKANGYYIAFLDDDDTWMPNKIELQISLFESSKDVSLVTCSYLNITPGKKTKIINIFPVKNEQELLQGNNYGGASMYLTTKTNLENLGGFDKSLSSGQDWDLLIKMYQIGTILICNTPLVNYISHNDVRISNSFISSYKGLRDIYLKYNHKMNNYTKFRHLAELKFYRLKLSNSITIINYKKFINVLKKMLKYDAFIFSLRYFRFLILNK
jgi:glycosyltransferase involved in cell wall biosynthesis